MSILKGDLLRSRAQELYQKQQKAVLEGCFLEIETRRKALKSLETAIMDHERQLVEALIEDFNKPELEIMETEFSLVLSDLRHTLKHLKKWARPQRVASPIHQILCRSRIYKEPFGMALIMAPWNYPFQLLMIPAIAALAAGNAVFLRPSTRSLRTAEVVASIFKAALPEEQAAVLLCDSSDADFLLDYKWDIIFFTGSPRIGKVLYQKAAAHLTPVILELGGKSPAVVCADCNVKATAQKIAWAKTLNAGQTCVSPDYVILHESVKEHFLTELEAAFRNISCETSYYDRQPHIISDSPYNRLKDMVKEAQERGARVIECGTSQPDSRFLAPHIIDLTDRGEGLRCMTEEIFGPVLPIVTYKEESEIQEIVSLNPHPLAFYLFSQNLSWARKQMARFSYGGGCINEAVIQLANPNLPFGGVGKSGLGVYHGEFGFNTFSHSKGVVEKRIGFDWPFLHRPYTKAKTSLIRFFLNG